MPTINKIKITAYADHHDYAIKDDGIFIAKKHRPTDIHGVYKATEAYEVILDIDDKEIQSLIKKKPSYCDCVATKDLIEYLKTKGILPNERLLVFNDDWKWDFVNKDGFMAKNPPHVRVEMGKIVVFAISDFKKCKPTKKEQEIIDTLNNRKKMQNLNNIAVVDNIVKVLRNNNYEIDLEKANQWREHDAFFFHDKKAFNTLVKDALEYYLNNIVLKDLGCKITVPKQKSTHGYKYDDVLCYVGDIELEEGVQDEVEGRD
jgi:succinate dehydrogenase flavin-adding protein (antitoxin of CptAB toxin-antitoxin module)